MDLMGSNGDLSHDEIKRRTVESIRGAYDCPDGKLSLEAVAELLMILHEKLRMDLVEARQLCAA
jgi:hypothetical protein